jgi:hypothetical protein
LEDAAPDEGAIHDGTIDESPIDSIGESSVTANWDSMPYELKPDSAYVNNAAKLAEGAVERLARREDKTGLFKNDGERYVSELAEAYRLMAERPVAVQVPESRVMAIVREGFKTMREVTSHIGYDPATGATDLFYQQERINYEKFHLGAPKDVSPVYGHLHADPISTRSAVQAENLTAYGAFQFVLRDSIKGRTTMSAGDTLNSNLIPVQMRDVIEGKATFEQMYAGGRPSVGEFDTMRALHPDTPMEARSSEYSPEQLAREYWEVQIHGPVTMDDVVEIRISEKDASRFQLLYPTEYAELEATGKLRVYNYLERKSSWE